MESNFWILGCEMTEEQTPCHNCLFHYKQSQLGDAMFSTDAIHAGGRGRRPPPTLLKEVRIKLTSDILEGRASPTPPKISLSDTPAHKTTA